MNKELKRKIILFSRKCSGNNFVAGFDHYQRVYRLAKRLVKKFDDDILFTACFLHDIDSTRPHNEFSAKKAKHFLSSTSFPKDKITRVYEAIKEHVKGGQPRSKEAIILHDADLLDFLGATGIVRLPVIAVNYFKINELEELIMVLKKYFNVQNYLILPSAKRLAQKKINLMKKFISQLKKEIN
jgi:uncharacterized protein